MYTKLVDGKVRYIRMDSETYGLVKAHEDAIEDYIKLQQKLDPSSDTYEKDYMEYENGINDCCEKINEIIEGCDFV